MGKNWIRQRRVVVEEKRKRARLGEIAKNLFEATGKNPYYRGNKIISNFEELKGNLTEFTESEAPWVASWIEYLGDAETAQKIRTEPSKFKEIIANRYYELRPHASKSKP